MHSTTSNDSRVLSQQSAAPSSDPVAPPLSLPPRSSSDRSSRYRRRMVTSLFLLLVLLVLLVDGIAFSLDPEMSFFSPRATITLTPRSALERQSVTIEAVTGTPHQGQAQARLLAASTQTWHATVPATGNVQQGTEVARGQITFYNLATYSISIQAGVTLTASSGVQIMTDAAAQVPAGNPPSMGSYTVPAHAVLSGTSGNIAAGAIDALCCANGIVAKNQLPFSGGQDARSFTAVQQQDIQSASSPLVTSLTQIAQGAIKAQLHPGERFTQTNCSPDVQADHQVGQEATQVTVAVAVTCRAEVYNQQQVTALATALFQQRVRAALGPNYALSGQVTASGGQATVIAEQPGTLAISTPVRGLWVYQIDRSAFRVKQIAGEDPTVARATLMQVPGVVQAAIQLSGWDTTTLPTDVNQIEIVVTSPPDREP